jgi:hypothetical protein
MGQAGRCLAEQRFNPRMVAERTRAVYQEIVNASPAGE